MQVLNGNAPKMFKFSTELDQHTVKNGFCTVFEQLYITSNTLVTSLFQEMNICECMVQLHCCVTYGKLWCVLLDFFVIWYTTHDLGVMMIQTTVDNMVSKQH